MRNRGQGPPLQGPTQGLPTVRSPTSVMARLREDPKEVAATAYDAVNAVDHAAKKCPKGTLDTATTTFTLASIISSLCDQCGLGWRWGLASVGAGGLAFMTTTASINKQFSLADKKSDLADKKADLGRLEMKIGFARLGNADVTTINALQVEIDALQVEIDALQAEIDELKGKIDVLEGKTTPIPVSDTTEITSIAADGDYHRAASSPTTHHHR